MHIFSLFRCSWDILSLYLFGFLWVHSGLLLQSKDFQFKWILTHTSISGASDSQVPNIIISLWKVKSRDAQINIKYLLIL